MTRELRTARRINMNNAHARRSRAAFVPKEIRRLAPELKFCLVILCLFIPFGMAYLPGAFALLAYAVSFWLVWLAKAESMPLLFILYLAPRDFFEAGDWMSDGIIQTDANLQLLKVWVIGVAALRITWEFFDNPHYLSGYRKGWFVLWLIFMVPAALSTLWGHTEGYENWTRSMRFVATAATFFYGILLSQRSQGSLIGFARFLLFLSCGLVTAATFGWFAQHLLFFLVGMAASLGIYFFQHGTLVERLAATYLLLISGIFAYFNSLAIIGIFSLSLVLALAIGVARLKPVWGKVITGAAVLAIPILVIIAISSAGTAAYIGPEYSTHGNLWERIGEKIAGDRGPIWIEAWHQIIAGPYLLAPSGRPLMVLDVTHASEIEWLVGAHNTILETFRNGGILVGAFCIGFVLMQLFRLRAVFVNHGGSLVGACGIAVFSIAVVGLTVGDFPLDHNIGLWIWAIAGFCVEVGESRRPTVLPGRLHRALAV